eukprot:CAMPEP_0175841910 /NCGR_PEP_ID=MMETSP0107_2-20121207/20191_1 /TAXON_ID=195067 ORGANISM="Goniomonas pacifica, Strain CCMP1869" /NCGR_SAMPLE_ID=MMETSP0107_2 /ASSEMBLY_ACC=CAM_ASM_000203 /LENGTH=35 /DNA_ID= /DNA_START= /DNA_END= /DNA_ORIENTATION=
MKNLKSQSKAMKNGESEAEEEFRERGQGRIVRVAQ